MSTTPDELTGHAEGSLPRRIFAWSVFPLTLVAAMTLVLWLSRTGRMELHFALIPGIVGAGLIVIASERIQPHSPFWTRSHGDVRTDLTHMVFSQLLPPPLVDAALTATVGVLAISLAGDGGPLWPSDLPFIAQLALAAIIGEFGQYWWHRLCHENAWFWRFHATHHSAPRLWWLNAGRFHPLDTVFAHTLTMSPLILIGCTGEVVAGMAVLTAVHGMFQHANIDLRLGPLNWIFSMAELHRWHHSRSLEDANKNYGANIIFWDIIFGTRHLPKDRIHDPKDVGFDGVDGFPSAFLGQVGSLFQWGKVQAAVDANAAAEEAG